MLVLGPLACWAQAQGDGVGPQTVKPVASARAFAAAKSGAPEDVSLDQLRERLALTGEQQAAWSAFESRVGAYTAAYYRQKPVLPAPEDAVTNQVGRMVDNLQNRLAALEDVESAVKTLFASLTPAQQKIANEMLILTVPTFTPASAPTGPSEARGKGDRPDGGKRSHRGGAGGGFAPPMGGN